MAWVFFVWLTGSNGQVRKRPIATSLFQFEIFECSLFVCRIVLRLDFVMFYVDCFNGRTRKCCCKFACVIYMCFFCRYFSTDGCFCDPTMANLFQMIKKFKNDCLSTFVNNLIFYYQTVYNVFSEWKTHVLMMV